MRDRPTLQLLLGLSLTLAAVAVFSLYALRQIEGLRRLQTDTIDRNRRDSLQLLRIQNNLHAMGLAMRDMVDGQVGYPIEAWRGEFDRIRYDLEDAVRLEGELASRPEEQREYLSQSLQQFWISVDEVFNIAQSGEAGRARKIIANSLQAQQAALASTVARLLVHNNELEEEAAAEIQRIYDGVERNTYIFLSAMLVAVAGIGLAVIYYNRRIFERLAVLSEQRSTLARRLIGVQEEVFRSVSRELHDEFGQILTAIGTMLRRAEKKGLPPDSPLREDIAEVTEIVQETLEKTRSFSQALHPTILDDYGLEKAIERYMPAFERQTGITVRFEKDGSAPVPDDKAIHIYRVLQEALNNVAKHSRSNEAWVRVRFAPKNLRLEVEDRGVGMNGSGGGGLGLIAMRERAELLHGKLSVGPGAAGGTLVFLEVPLDDRPS